MPWTRRCRYCGQGFRKPVGSQMSGSMPTKKKFRDPGFGGGCHRPDEKSSGSFIQNTASISGLLLTTEACTLFGGKSRRRNPCAAGGGLLATAIGGGYQATSTRVTMLHHVGEPWCTEVRGAHAPLTSIRFFLRRFEIQTHQRIPPKHRQKSENENP